MQSEQKQRIMGYFIEESKEHLKTMEQAVVNLQSTIEDQAVLNEVYRAAHSIKGGAAMLELNSIQKTAHCLEDCFKNLQESPLQADQHLESLFLRVFYTLQKLIKQLEEPSGITNETADEIMSDPEPVLEELSNHLQKLQQQASSFPAVTAQELVLTGSSMEINPKEELEALVPKVASSMSRTDVRGQEFKEDNPKVIYPDQSLIPTDDDSGIIFAQPIPDGTIDDMASQTKHTPTQQGTDVTAAIGDSKPVSLRHAEVGLAELDTLADIFEGQTPELDETWEKEEIISLDGSELASDSINSLSLDDQSDFFDLIGDLDSWETSVADSKVLRTQETSAPTSEDFIDWLGEDFLEEVTLNSQDAATDDFSDLLFEAENPESLTAEADSTKNLSSLFGDTSEILGDGEDLDFDQLESDQEIFGLGEEVTAKGLEPKENSQSLALEGLFAESTPPDLEEEAFDWQSDLFGTEASAPTEQLETNVPTTAEVDELASLLGQEIPAVEQELDWQSDLFSTEASAPTEQLETNVPTTAEVDELASLLGQEIPAVEQELDWQSDLFSTEASAPTEQLETNVPTTAEVDELASLLGEEMPAQEQQLDWQSDLFSYRGFCSLRNNWR